MYCRKCGAKIDSSGNFCPICGTEINAKNKFCLKGTWTIILICLIGCVLTAYSILVLNPDELSKLTDSHQLTNRESKLTDQDTEKLTQEQQNIKICEQLAAEYYKTHTYKEDNVYDCDNMAQDIWDMLEKKNINARIAIGSLYVNTSNGIEANHSGDKSSESCSLGKIKANCDVYENSNISDPGQIDKQAGGQIDSYNHAWVLAEVSPGSWLAIECTGGYVVYSEDNENYYQGLTFSNPRNYRSFLELYDEQKIRAQEYEAQRLYYNELVEKFNNATYSEQLIMKSGIEAAKDTLVEKEKAFLKTDTELNALIKYG
jgi:hypothetical protein